MSITLEERLRRAGELLDEVTVQPVAGELRVAPSRSPKHGGSPVWLRAAAAVLVTGAMVGVAWLSARDSSDQSATGTTTAAPENTAAETTAGGASETTAAPDTTSAGSTETTAAAELGPSVTLPLTSDLSTTPVTVQGSGPTSWYRLQPDLDVAWYSDGNTSQLCFRTPAIEQCQPDRFVTGGYVAVQTAGGQWVVLTIDNVDQIVVTLDGGVTASVTVRPDSQIGWRTGRLQGPAPLDASMVFPNADAIPSDTTAVPGSLSTQP